MMKKSLILIVCVVGLIVLSGCGAPAPQDPGAPASDEATATPAQPVRVPLVTPEKINVEVGPSEPQIFMLEPQDNVKTTSPFYLRVGTANLKVPLLSAILHININAPCIPAGQTIPQDEQHVSLPMGQWGEPRFALPVGQHRLCLQASDSQNVALEGPGLTRIIDIEIVP